MAINIISVSIFGIIGIRTKKVLRCERYLGENKIDLFIILNKTPCFLSIDGQEL